MKLSTSVIIPTYNGAHKIMGVLRSLETQTLAPDEVIVVIDGSTDGTAELLKGEQFRLAGFRIIEQANGGRAQVRNRGAAEASKNLLLFVDDDMIVPEDWVNNHHAHHTKHERSILTGKLDAHEPDLSNDFFLFRYWLHEKWSKDAQHSEEEFIQEKPYITATNLSMTRSLFQQLGGFDTRLRDAEDYDLAQRAMNAGIPVYFSSKVVNYNNDVDNVTCVKVVKRLREYAQAQRVLRELKPELYKDDHQYAATAPGGLKGQVFRFFCSRWWIESIDRKYWTWVPRSLRYKLYDIVITANGSFFPNRVSI